MNNLREYTILGVSGGADSMYMLHQFLNVKNIIVAHVNYNIRKDSHLDEELVKTFCEKNNIPFYSLSVKPESDTGIEEWARNIRYNFFSNLLKELNYKWIATAHNANDQAETVIMRMERGCGLKGLRGILPETNNIYRPFLHLKKSFIYSECHRLNIPYREDSTNTDQKYYRNYIRHNKVDNSNIDHLCRIARDSFIEYSKKLKKANELISNATVINENEIWIHKDFPNDDIGFIAFDVLMSKLNISIETKHWEIYHSNKPNHNVFKLNNFVSCDKRKKNINIIRIASC
jgi:tRNA(Ile)-lysidine synthase